jgi:hypothetical protein
MFCPIAILFYTGNIFYQIACNQKILLSVNMLSDNIMLNRLLDKILSDTRKNVSNKCYLKFSDHIWSSDTMLKMLSLSDNIFSDSMHQRMLYDNMLSDNTYNVNSQHVTNIIFQFSLKPHTRCIAPTGIDFRSRCPSTKGRWFWLRIQPHSEVQPPGTSHRWISSVRRYRYQYHLTNSSFHIPVSAVSDCLSIIIFVI